MKDQILKIAGVKNEKEFYKKYPTEEAFMAKHGAKLKKAAMGSNMVNKQLHQLTEWEGVPMAQGGIDLSPIKSFQSPGAPSMSALSGKLSDPTFQQQAIKNVEGITPAGSGVGSTIAMAGLQGVGQIIGGIEAIGAQKKAQKKAQQASQLSGLALQAQSTMEKPKRKYVRPEDSLVQPDQLGNPYGSGTNYLAANGTRIGGNPTEIQNIYNPGDVYTNLEFEPLGETLKQFKKGGNLPEAEFGEYFQDSGQAQIGSAVGGAIGSAFGPAGQMVGSLLGKIGGNLLGGAKDARELAKTKAQTELNQGQLAMQQSGQFSANLKDGGWVSNDWTPQVIAKFGEYDVKDLLKPPHDADMLRSGGHFAQVGYTAPSAEAMFTGKSELKPLTMDNGGRMTSTNMMFDTDRYPRAEYGSESNMNGDLEVIDGGKAETISYNPNLPDGGETVMFKGRSHDNGGIPISFGENGVEVEGGEPAVKLEDGGKENNMVVFGNMKINKNIANLMGDPKAKDMKFKHYIADTAKNDRKQVKTISKAIDIVNNANNNSKSGQLAMLTGKLMKDGAEQWQKINAEKIKQAGIVQNAILDTASELGVKSDKLAEGKLEKEYDPRMMAKDGKKLKKADFGKSSNITGVDMFGNYTGPQEAFSDTEDTGMGIGSKALNVLAQGASAIGRGVDKYGNTILSNVAPWLRPSNANEALNPDQLYPEYYALATNQLEPVQAQTYQPMLDTPMDISLNDQINAVDSQARAAIRAAGNNPAAQTMIMTQALEAKNKVLGEQTRINAANKMETYNRNRAALNDAQLKNLQILDQQYVRQAQAKSNTKEQTLAALSSIAAKTAQQRASNRKLAVLENMYGFRFTPSGKAINMNAPAQFNLFGNPSATGNRGLAPDRAFTYDEQGQIVGTRPIPKSKQVSMDELDNAFEKNGGKTSKKNARNSSIVKALKNL